MTWIDEEVAKRRSEKLKAERYDAIRIKEEAEIKSAMQKFLDLLLKQNKRLPREIRLRADEASIGDSYFFRYDTYLNVLKPTCERLVDGKYIALTIKYSPSKKTYFAIKTINRRKHYFYLIHEVERFIDKLLQMGCTDRPIHEALDDQSPVKTCDSEGGGEDLYL